MTVIHFYFLFPDNDISSEHLHTFSENDVQDLFKKFMDRMHVRRFLSTYNQKINCNDYDASSSTTSSLETSQNSSSASLEENQEMSEDPEDLVDDPDRRKKEANLPKSSENCVTRSSCPYTSQQMLDRKLQRGHPNESQKFFANLLRDCAKGANLWKTAPCLSSISSSRRNVFYEAMFRVAPNLEAKKRDVWQRLAQTLQNRRKYLRDKITGRIRSSTPKKVPESSGSECCNKIALGGKVILLDSARKEIGQGILILGNERSMFAEIALKATKLDANSVSIPDYELPEPVCINGSVHTTLSSALKNSVIKWRMDRLSPDPSGNRRKSTETDPCPSGSKRSSAESGSGSCHSDRLYMSSSKPKTSTETGRPKPTETVTMATMPTSKPNNVVKGKKSTESHTMPTSKPSQAEKGKKSTASHTIPTTKPSHAEKGKKSTESQLSHAMPTSKPSHAEEGKKSAASPTMPTSKPSHAEEGNTSIKFKAFVLMEWGGGKYYWGIVQTADFTNDYIVRNCTKPCGKKGDTAQEIINSCSSSSLPCKLSNTDFEVNPDESFGVWKLPSTNQMMSLEPCTGSKYGKICMKDINSHMEVFQEKLDNYEKKV